MLIRATAGNQSTSAACPPTLIGAGFMRPRGAYHFPAKAESDNMRHDRKKEALARFNHGEQEFNQGQQDSVVLRPVSGVDVQESAAAAWSPTARDHVEDVSSLELFTYNDVIYTLQKLETCLMHSQDIDHDSRSEVKTCSTCTPQQSTMTRDHDYELEFEADIGFCLITIPRSALPQLEKRLGPKKRYQVQLLKDLLQAPVVPERSRLSKRSRSISTAALEAAPNLLSQEPDDLEADRDVSLTKAVKRRRKEDVSEQELEPSDEYVL
ncbi:hypothetical protein R1sor_023088 [Riccia sorocarpa]|uniref:Uncharacterized protein n=1 Tax=Riccia sorocarpa TaxID=122646 RepID=A0ABD3GLQ2_9MARC